MHEQTIAVLHQHRQLGQEPPLRDVEAPAGPFDRDLRLGIHGLGRRADRFVMIAAHGDGTVGDQLHRGLHDPFGIGAIADEIAEQDEPLRALGAGDLQARLERLPVAVDIREDSEKHAPSTLKFLLEADKAKLREVNKMRQRGAVYQHTADVMVKRLLLVLGRHPGRRQRREHGALRAGGRGIELPGRGIAAAGLENDLGRHIFPDHVDQAALAAAEVRRAAALRMAGRDLVLGRVGLVGQRGRCRGRGRRAGCRSDDDPRSSSSTHR